MEHSEIVYAPFFIFSLPDRFLILHQFCGGFFDVFDLRQDEIFDFRRVSDERVRRADAFDRSVQIFEQFVRDSRRDFRAVTV